MIYQVDAFTAHLFGGNHGIDEDLRSMHCVLAPYWCEGLDKSTLQSQPVSKRGSDLHCSSRASAC
jgi:predicted PhzF superfamily epimerase YddE/YHI9